MPSCQQRGGAPPFTFPQRGQARGASLCKSLSLVTQLHWRPGQRSSSASGWASRGARPARKRMEGTAVAWPTWLVRFCTPPGSQRQAPLRADLFCSCSCVLFLRPAVLSPAQGAPIISLQGCLAGRRPTLSASRHQAADRPSPLPVCCRHNAEQDASTREQVIRAVVSHDDLLQTAGKIGLTC